MTAPPRDTASGRDRRSAVPKAERPLSGQEQDRLEAFVEGDNPFGWKPMPMDMLQGFLCGVASAPEDVKAEDWLPWAFGIETPPETRPEAIEWFDLAERFYRQQVPALEAQADAELVLYDESPGASNRLEYWCIGFLDGLEMAAEPLEVVGDPEEVDELLFPVRVLGDALSPAEKKRFSDKEWAKLLAECEAELWPAVVSTYRYGNALRHKPVTVRRDAPKTGRNDPCPCDSGRKFKNCCGRDAPAG
ncbi:MAG: UPF0149 family protein [Betaproteobacteria bacterium]